MEDMKIYKVVFKNGAERYYGFKEDCQIGDTVVADTSHGPLLGRIAYIPDELPDDHDANKLRFILCRVPVANKDSVEYRKEQLEKRMAALDQAMDEFIEREKKNYLRFAFSDYSDEFRKLFDEYTESEDELNLLGNTNQDVIDDDDDEDMDD